jgi:hypothetical protein
MNELVALTENVPEDFEIKSESGPELYGLMLLNQ